MASLAEGIVRTRYTIVDRSISRYSKGDVLKATILRHVILDGMDYYKVRQLTGIHPKETEGIVRQYVEHILSNPSQRRNYQKR